MSNRLSSRSCWRKCWFRRLYSSSAVETSQQPRRAPIANDLGGIQIVSPSGRFPRPLHQSDSLDLRDFRHGTLSKRLAIRELRERSPSENAQSQNLTRRYPTPSKPQYSQTQNPNSSPRESAPDVRPRQQRRNVDMGRNHRSPGKRDPWTKPRSSVQNKMKREEALQLYEEDETDAIDDDVDATKTSFHLRRPDPPLAHQKPPLPPSLTILDQRVYIDTQTEKLLEQQGGDYVRYFSPNEWKIARAQTSEPLGVVDYARLTLHLNRTVSVPQRQEGVEIVRKHVPKGNHTTAAH